MLAVVALVLATIALTFGDYPLALPKVLAALTGGSDPLTQRIVLAWRLPVAVAALVFGALLGVGGAVFQSLTRNPLGSPDVIGFDAGAYTGVVLALLVVRTADYWSLAAAALAGGVVTALVVALLAHRDGMRGFRLIVVGIAIAAVLGALNSYLVTRASVQDALTVGIWAAGSLARVSWDSMGPALVAAVVVFAATALLSPSIERLELGDDTARSHGVHPARARIALLVVGVSTTALVTAAAGPLSFIALVAPQLARRVTRAPGAGLLGAAAMGAVLLSAAHLLSVIAAACARPVPAGLVTVCLGGLYLIHLLVREARTRAARL